MRQVIYIGVVHQLELTTFLPSTFCCYHPAFDKEAQITDASDNSQKSDRQCTFDRVFNQ